MDCGDDKHDHTVTFIDDDGQSFSFDHACPTEPEVVRNGLIGTGATSVNDFAVDGTLLPFETVFMALGDLGLMDLLGMSYRTADNLFRVLAVMGGEPGADEGEEVST